MATSPSSADTPTRRTFALTGRSVTLDPRTHAVRPDLADVRLAGQVFAPHFAAPLMCRIARDTALLVDRAGGAAVAALAGGEPFEVLELADDHAWGRAPERGLVGYVVRADLGAA